MMALDRLRDSGFGVVTRNHSDAILAQDFAAETAELVDALLGFRLPITEVIGSGGGEALSTQRLRRRLTAAGWPKHVFDVRLTVDGVTREAISHEIDHVRLGERGVLALEIEWNNKDPFFDRDLENFQRLHALSAISAGIIVTRGEDLHAGMTGVVEAFLTRLGATSADDLAAFGMKRRTDRQSAALDRATGRPGRGCPSPAPLPGPSCGTSSARRRPTGASSKRASPAASAIPARCS